MGYFAVMQCFKIAYYQKVEEKEALKKQCPVIYYSGHCLAL